MQFKHTVLLLQVGHPLGQLTHVPVSGLKYCELVQFIHVPALSPRGGAQLVQVIAVPAHVRQVGSQLLQLFAPGAMNYPAEQFWQTPATRISGVVQLTQFAELEQVAHDEGQETHPGVPAVL